MLTFRDKNGRIGILETNVTPSNTAKLVKTQKNSKTNIPYVWQQQQLENGLDKFEAFS